MANLAQIPGGKPPPDEAWLAQAAEHLLAVGRAVGIRVTGLYVELDQDKAEDDTCKVEFAYPSDNPPAMIRNLSMETDPTPDESA